MSPSSDIINQTYGRNDSTKYNNLQIKNSNTGITSSNLSNIYLRRFPCGAIWLILKDGSLHRIAREYRSIPHPVHIDQWFWSHFKIHEGVSALRSPDLRRVGQIVASSRDYRHSITERTARRKKDAAWRRMKEGTLVWPLRLGTDAVCVERARLGKGENAGETESVDNGGSSDSGRREEWRRNIAREAGEKGRSERNGVGCFLARVATRFRVIERDANRTLMSSTTVTATTTTTPRTPSLMKKKQMKKKQEKKKKHEDEERRR